MALAGGAYLRYAVGFVAAVAVVSPLVTAVVVSVPVVGLVVGLPAGAVLGLAGNLATMRFVADADAETTAFEERSADDGPTGAGDE
ncbi:hypothetical protein [Halobaculum litoreum]|uniref:Uncharacterized protein n=1 Tax=Halobaculum litoreum TaxID=3031998 RepID=A0ABD5XS00_9EURY|nr:hypothetical protein [Halobaculum sp. DT92]